MSRIENSAQSKPEYLKGSRDIGGETVRVTGNVNIPDNETVEFSLVVFGDLNAGRSVSFLGGLHVEGNVRLGELNSVRGSIHCEGNMMIGPQTTIEKAVYCLGILLIGKGVRIGLGEDGGGVVCKSVIYVEQEFTAGAKVEAEKIVTVEKLDEELISKLDKERPKPRQRPKESSLVSRGDCVPEQTRSGHIAWQKTEHNGNGLHGASNQQSPSGTDRMVSPLTDRLINLSLDSRTIGLQNREEKCPSCGSSITENARFCDMCGLRLRLD